MTADADRHVAPDLLELRRLSEKFGRPTLTEALAALERAGVDPGSVTRKKATP